MFVVPYAGRVEPRSGGDKGIQKDRRDGCVISPESGFVHRFRYSDARERMKHPYHPYTTEDALSLARDIICGPLPLADAPTPTIDEAVVAIEDYQKHTDFNWITGRVALEVLRASRGDKVEFKP